MKYTLIGQTTIKTRDESLLGSPATPYCFVCKGGLVEGYWAYVYQERTEAQRVYAAHAGCKPLEPPARPSWDATFMAVAEVMARRGTCDRAQVGAVAVRAKQILAEGYNGALEDEPHCDEIGHDMVDSHCVRALHAEANLATQNVDLTGATVYTTHYPCWPCFCLLAREKVVEIVYQRPYRSDTVRIDAVAQRKGIVIRQYQERAHV